MPRLFLPADLSGQLENSESGTIDNTTGPGVAAYLSSDGSTRADIYVGLKMDGVKLYENISTVHPNVKVQFALGPTISCQSEELDFDPSKHKVIVMKVIVFITMNLVTLNKINDRKVA